MIKFRCSNCNKKFGVPDDYAGRRIRCNTCNQHSIVPKPVTDSDRVAATERSQADSNVTVNPAPSLSAKDKPAELLFKLQPDSSDDELITAETLFNTPKSSDADIQLQSFHHFTPSDSVIAGTDPKPAAENSVSDLIQRSCPNRKTDRIEQTLDFLSYISCIGPVFFILIIFAAGFIASHNNSPRSMRPPFAEPATGPIEGPTSFLAAFPAIRYTFYAFACGISPLALIGSLFLVFRYSYDMPKTLYFSIVIHGLIFFNIFRG